MRCVFCKAPSGTSRSREHPIPESLGNKTMVLRPGVVCDGCNNYFSRKVERPFLDSNDIRTLRFSQGVYSKKGRIPTVIATAGLASVELSSTGWGGPTVIGLESVEDLDPVFDARMLLGPEGVGPPTGVTSRFIAKVAIGWLAARVQDDAAQLDEFVDFTPADPVRVHARYGVPRTWPVTCRQTYASDQLWDDGHGGLEQRKWEATVFPTDDGAPHFAVALFGREFVISLDGPDLSAFRRWVLMHPGDSPVLSGPYAHERSRMRSTTPRRRRAYVVLTEPS